jgi:site-specific DNA-cytosine methylase
MKNKIILDLCGGTGSWSKPYTEAGYEVKNITYPKYDVLKAMFTEKTVIFPGIPAKESEEVDICRIHGILAAPPCTMFSLARTRAKTPRNFKQGMECVIACLNIIWECRYRNKLAFWCMENPMGYLRQFLGKPVMTFDPCDYGDPYTKRTDLWGYFNIPKKKPVKMTDEQIERCKMNNRKLPSIRGITKQSDRRAITPAGFAKAFFEAYR